MNSLLIALAIAAMVVSLLMIPLGLPGTWVMIGIICVGAFYGLVGLPVLLLLIVLAGLAELAEFVLVNRLNLRYGGSSRAFWGAILGGIIGIFVGVPVPVVGSLIAGVLGSFVGAAVVTWLETRRLRSAGRVGWGVLIGRALAAAAKTAAGVVILVVGAAALLVN